MASNKVCKEMFVETNNVWTFAKCMFWLMTAGAAKPVLRPSLHLNHTRVAGSFVLTPLYFPIKGFDWRISGFDWRIKGFDCTDKGFDWKTNLIEQPSSPPTKDIPIREFGIHDLCILKGVLLECNTWSLGK